MQQTIAEEAARILDSARAQTDTAVRGAKLELKNFAAEKAVDQAEELIRTRLDESGRRRLVTQFVASLVQGTEELAMPTVVANRYARALADVIASAGNYRQVLGEFEDFSAAYHQSVELREVCDTPAVAMAQKLNVLEAIAGKMGSSHVTLNFLRVLMSHYRFALLGEFFRPSATLPTRVWESPR